jgi:uncharacterized membrane protein required for colicin V production
VITEIFDIANFIGKIFDVLFGIIDALNLIEILVRFSRWCVKVVTFPFRKNESTTVIDRRYN